MKVVFAGTPEFAAGHLKALINSNHEVSGVVCQPDRPGKRGKKLVIGPVKKAAIDAGLEVLQPAKLSIAALEQLNFDLLVVVAYGQVLTSAVLDYPRFGCINVHASLLPRWRGAAPVQRSILAGDSTTGVTIMQIDEGLDTGDMLATKSFTIESTDTSGSILTKMLNSGAPLLVETIDKFEAGKILPVKQDAKDASYASKIRVEEGNIDWTRPAIEVDRLVRAFQPVPAAFTYLGNIRAKIHRGFPIDGAALPGSLIRLTSEGIDIACGDGAYRVQAIQLAVGKGKIMSPAELLNGRADLLKAASLFTSTPNDV